MSHQLLWTDLFPESVLNNWNSIDFRILVTGNYPEYLMVNVSSLRQNGKKKPFVSRPDFYTKEIGRAVFFVIYYFLLHAFFTHYYLPQGYVGALGSNINKTKHQILIKHKFVKFWYMQRVNSENLHSLYFAFSLYETEES